MPRRYWLVKSDPETFGWEDLKASAGRRTVWDGVRNYQARNLLRDDVKRGDGVLFYHSGSERAIVGTCKVVTPGFPDPKDAIFTAVEIALDREFAAPVALAAMRDVPALAGMMLLRKGSRLSVQPVSATEWDAVVELGAGDSRKKG